jgi:hypothetical protein
MAQDAGLIKEKILSFIRNNGPSIPVHISQAAGLSILFTSAFLSELLSDRQLKISNMRVGSSPIYFIPGQEPQLEKFSNYLKSKEKEAYILLNEKKFLKDSEQEPAIRVALRSIKDFAVPFEKNEEIIWRYFIAEESGYQNNSKNKPEEEKVEITVEKEVKVDEPKDTEEKKDSLDIFEKKSEEKQEKKETKKKTTRTSSKSSVSKKTSAKKSKEDSKFFNRVKDFLSEKNIEILDIEEIAINKIIFRVKEEKEYLIVAYNKKRITEEDITKAYKKADEMSLEYKILCFGDTLKKIDNLISAAKTLKSIEKIE